MSPVEYSPLARDDLGAIWDFIAADDTDAADRFVDELLEECNRLAEMPRIGRKRPEYGRTLRSFPFRDYLIFYRSASFGIEVARVVSGFRDLDRLTWPKD